MGTDTPNRHGTILVLWRRVLIGITAAGAVVASFIFLTDLAVHAGWPSDVAWLLPLCIDSLAGMALTGYRLTGDRTAAAVAVLAIAFSAVGNAASHWYSTGLLTPDWITVTVVGAVPAVALGLCIHIATKGASWTTSKAGGGSSESASGSGTGRPNRGRSGAPDAEPGTPATNRNRNQKRASTKTRSSSPKRTDTELIKLICENSWQRETLDSLVSRLRVSKRRASTLRTAAQQASSTQEPGPESEPEPSQNGQPADPDNAVEAVLAPGG